jgi:hypothetical protein
MLAIHVKHPDDAPDPRAYGPRTSPEEPRRCRTPGCSRPLPPGCRRHVCSRCGVAASRNRSVAGKRCAVCSTPDIRVLAVVELADGEHVLCANDRAIAGRLGLTLDELRAEAGRGSAELAA